MYKRKSTLRQNYVYIYSYIYMNVASRLNQKLIVHYTRKSRYNKIVRYFHNIINLTDVSTNDIGF